jgi:YfiH family protein
MSVPGLDAAMELPGGARVLFTNRDRGNLSSRSGEARAGAILAREDLREELALTALAHARQVHGTTVRVIDDRASLHAATERGADEEADGQATVLPNVGLVAFTADCLPVALASRDAVAMLHAGWRGLAAGILERGVRALREAAGAGEVVAAIGPGAGACCYEVGEEVHAALGSEYRRGANIDLKAVARERLHAAGVQDVRDLELCTICEPRFFSHRREGERAGRQGGVAWRQ